MNLLTHHLFTIIRIPHSKKKKIHRTAPYFNAIWQTWMDFWCLVHFIWQILRLTMSTAIMSLGIPESALHSGRERIAYESY